MKNLIVLGLLLFCLLPAEAQTNDSIPIKTATLDPITIQAYRLPPQKISYLKDVEQTFITSGKRNEVIQLDGLPANIAEKTGRQVYAKIPGAFIYDMDGSGNQVNIATRGLDPHRSWEFNVRQNGVITNSDMYGYPASHYSPPMEAVQKIELIRGTSSLQYGAQFGGMVNYIIKEADPKEKFSFENSSSVGSYGVLSTYNAVGGRSGKLSYYAYFHRRVMDGYRENARSDGSAQYASLKYQFSPHLSLKAELGRSEYLYQMPGPLTDAQFEENPRQSTRSRNYYSPDIYVPSLNLDWQLTPNTSIQWVTSAVLGTRSSVQFIGFADARDTIDATTLQYKSRQVDIDHFNSYTSELRMKHQYQLGDKQSTLVVGLRYINNDLHRQQLGKGTTGTDYDLTLLESAFGRDVRYKTSNVALSLENLFQIGSKLQLSPGIRIENGTTKMRGIIAYLPDEAVPADIEHQYVLLGLSGQYLLNGDTKIYGGWSQAYRPVILADVIPATLLDKIDPNLEDAFGYNAEIGIKGVLGNRLTYDLCFFQVLYKNRIGSLLQTDIHGNAFIYKTNIGDSRTNGIESYLDYKIAETDYSRFSVFTSTAFMSGQYLNGFLRSGSENVAISGNTLETVPQWISRNGFQFAIKRIAGILQYSYVSESFSDALNTATPTANGAAGIVPSYGIWDLNGTYRLSERLQFRLSVNNLSNKRYFTKRPSGYPGPGIWSSDGRGVVATVQFRL
ncbi:MAG TPA: TonB-dependent receptor [Saprospiraceae bacterium]|nr:TonB-dependent receptor [Saprospiraceae bacterium]HMQ81584.1 TonB-dependent receptor [Saprospiraceae bacterium]